uniref:Uncharacterized protein n=1 Tax=Eutreptiella gymnastica TaxID=73025 RepID=A0A7S4FIZ7_9EUGL
MTSSNTFCYAKAVGIYFLATRLLEVADIETTAVAQAITSAAEGYISFNVVSKGSACLPEDYSQGWCRRFGQPIKAEASWILCLRQSIVLMAHMPRASEPCNAYIVDTPHNSIVQGHH